jgi:hypothetical protein
MLKHKLHLPEMGVETAMIAPALERATNFGTAGCVGTPCVGRIHRWLRPKYLKAWRSRKSQKL